MGPTAGDMGLFRWSTRTQAPSKPSAHLPQLQATRRQQAFHLTPLACSAPACAAQFVMEWLQWPSWLETGVWLGEKDAQCLTACDDERAAAAPPPSVLGTEDFVSSLGQQGEQASVANFGIPVRSFSSCSGETEEKNKDT